MTERKLLEVGKELPVNHELAGLVPMASEAEQSSLTEDIRANGLREPLVIWHGKIIDGRCRQKACLLSGSQIAYKEMDDSVSEEDARIYVKSVNTRRNLTQTQKIISACRESLRDASGSVKSIAEAWGISKPILDNARYIAKKAPEFIDPLFNGKSVTIINKNGEEVSSNKVTAIYAYVKKQNQLVYADQEHGWTEDSYIKTQVGKEWYYEQIKKSIIGKEQIQARMLIAELANYKFKEVNTETGEII